MKWKEVDENDWDPIKEGCLLVRDDPHTIIAGPTSTAPGRLAGTSRPRQRRAWRAKLPATSDLPPSGIAPSKISPAGFAAIRS